MFNNRQVWVMKMCYIHTIKCYIALVNDAIIQFAVTWMDLEFIKLNKVSWKKAKYMWYYMKKCNGSNRCCLENPWPQSIARKIRG